MSTLTPQEIYNTGSAANHALYMNYPGASIENRTKLFVVSGPLLPRLDVLSMVKLVSDFCSMLSLPTMTTGTDPLISINVVHFRS